MPTAEGPWLPAAKWPAPKEAPAIASAIPAQSTAPGPQQRPDPLPVSLRAVVIGLLLIPFNAWFILYGYVWGQSRPTTVSLYFNVIITLLIVCALNAVLGRISRRLALNQSELLVIYAMLAVASAVCGLDQIQTMLPVVAHPFWHATPENHWQQLFLEKIPPWLTVTDDRALRAYYEFNQPLFSTPYWRQWLVPMAWWSGFSFTLLFVMLSLSSLLRKQWTEEAKLSFPIVQLPLEMTRPHTPLWRSKLMWIGFGVAFVIDAINGLHRIWPQVPSLLGELSAGRDLGQIVKAMPWRAIGWTPITVFPFAVGLSFFIPLDLAFSSWFFYLGWKFVRIFSTAAGWGNFPARRGLTSSPSPPIWRWRSSRSTPAATTSAAPSRTPSGRRISTTAARPSPTASALGADVGWAC